MTPILSIETIISAMMCLCSSNSSHSHDFYSSLADKVNYNHPPNKPVILVQPTEIENVREKLTHLLEKVEEMQRQQDKITTTFEKTHSKISKVAPKIVLNSSPATECPRKTANENAGEEEVILFGIPGPEGKHEVFQGLCTSSGLLIIQQRFDGSMDFFLPWKDYRQGFGILNGEFFIGLERLHALATNRHYGLLIELEDFENDRRYAEYSQFVIGNETEGYGLKTLGRYEGTAGDSLRHHVGQGFTTPDQDHDAYQANCAVEYTGAWWYTDCLVSNLNGQYLKGPMSKEKLGKGMSWQTFRGLEYSLKISRMMIRLQE